MARIARAVAPVWSRNLTTGHGAVQGPIYGNDDILIKTKPLLNIVNKTWEVLLSTDAKDHEQELFRKHERTGRPLGDDSFIETMGLILGRDLKPQKPGPKKRNK